MSYGIECALNLYERMRNMKKRGKRLLLLTLVLTALLLTSVIPYARASEEIVSINIVNTRSYYKVGDSTEGAGQVQVSGRRADGTETSLTGDGALSYQFSNINALTVSTTGQITAVAAGGGVLTVSYGELSAKMYLGAYTGTAQIDSGEGDYPPTSANVVKTSEVARTGQYAIQLKNGGRWPKYNDNYDSAVSETWFYDDGTSRDTFFTYFQSTGNDTTYSPRKDGPSTAQYFVGFNKDVSTSHYYFRSYAGQRTVVLTGYDDTNMKVDSTATAVVRSQGWHQVTCVVNAGYESFDKTGTVEIYLDGNLIFTENYTHRFMGVMRPEGQGESGGIFDDLIYYTSGNNIPQTAPEARNLTIEGRPEAKFRLEAKYDYYDRNGDYEKPVAGTSVGASPIEWQVSDNGVDGWMTLSPAAQGNDSYVLTYNEMGKYVRFVVTPTSSDQNYAVVNTARAGDATVSQPVLVSTETTSWHDLDLSKNTTWVPLNGTKELNISGKSLGGNWESINGLTGLTYLSSDNAVVTVSEDGILTGQSPGVAQISVELITYEARAVDSIMVVVGSEEPLSQGFEGESTEQSRTGEHSLKLTGTQRQDFYGQSFAKNGVLEGWFYDDGTGGDREIYFQSGARGNTIPVTAMYSVGVKQSVSTNRYYVRNYKNGRVEAGGTGGTDEFATNIPRSSGWHQVNLIYQFGNEAYDTLGWVKIYLDGQEVFTENYSHENMQVIRGSVTNNTTEAYFDDFAFYDFDNESKPDLGEGTEKTIAAGQGEIIDLEFTSVEPSLNSVTDYTLNYLTSDFELYDLCGYTSKLENQTGTYAGVEILENSLTSGKGKIRFRSSGRSDQPENRMVIMMNKSANVVRLKAKRTGNLTVTWSYTR